MIAKLELIADILDKKLPLWWHVTSVEYDQHCQNYKIEITISQEAIDEFIDHYRDSEINRLLKDVNFGEL